MSAINGIVKLETGIAGLDDISLGGLPENRATLLAGTSGSCKTLLTLQFLASGIQKFGQSAVFVTFEETIPDIKRNIHSFGWDIDGWEKAGKFAFVDVSPDPEHETIETGQYDFSGLLARIEHAVRKVGAKRVGIDSISSTFSHFSDSGLVRKELFRIAAGLKLMDVTTIISVERTEEYGAISRFGVEEFVADNVMILRNTLEEEKRRRTIEILKLRGAPHQKGEYPCTISELGIEILPLSSLKLATESVDTRLSSGNKEVDEMCGGGHFHDSVILISGATGTGKTLMSTTFIIEGCRAGEKSLLIAFEESRAQLIRNASGWGMDLVKWEKMGLLKIMCAQPEIVGLADHLLKIKREVQSFQPGRMAVDSLSAMERVSTEKTFREFIIGITSFAKEKRIASMFTAVTASLMGGTSITEAHISTLTDSIILMRYVELMGQMRRGLTVLKMRGSAHDKNIREYTIDSSGFHIGKPFYNVSGILTGTPVQLIGVERQKLDEMF